MLLALDMEDHLIARGYETAGPYGRVAQALEAIPDLTLAGAIVDLNLAGELSFPVIDCLTQRGIPLIVCSGYAELPQVKARLGSLPLIAKPWSPERLDALMAQTFQADTRAPLRARRG
nr:response regulator [Rhizobium sp. CSW-27]